MKKILLGLFLLGQIAIANSVKLQQGASILTGQALHSSRTTRVIPVNAELLNDIFKVMEDTNTVPVQVIYDSKQNKYMVFYAVETRKKEEVSLKLDDIIK